MRLVLDTHTHTIASAHAYSTVAEMARAAADRKLELLAITARPWRIPAISCIL